jgi:hypothetical protein
MRMARDQLPLLDDQVAAIPFIPAGRSVYITPD